MDLLPYLTSPDAAPARSLRWRYAGSTALRRGPWKLVRGAEAEAAGAQALLFDLESDPGETTNLAAERPDDVTRLRAAWAEWNETLLETALLPPIRSTLAEFDGTWVQLLF